jgi:hypothetical protein
MNTLTSEDNPPGSRKKEKIAANKRAIQTIRLIEDKPLSKDLGKYRILRTSPLIEVHIICCENCKQQS